MTKTSVKPINLLDQGEKRSVALFKCNSGVELNLNIFADL